VPVCAPLHTCAHVLLVECSAEEPAGHKPAASIIFASEPAPAAKALYGGAPAAPAAAPAPKRNDLFSAGDDDGAEEGGSTQPM
jgi:hypothetical protein